MVNFDNEKTGRGPAEILLLLGKREGFLKLESAAIAQPLQE